MKVKEVRAYPESSYRLLNMVIVDKEFAYSIVRGKETFEVYHLDNSRNSGFRYSRSYRISDGQTVPQKYEAEFQFLKEEYNKIDWVSLELGKKLKR